MQDYLLQSITDYIRIIPSNYIYGVVALSNFIENLFPPWPTDVLSLFAGFLTSYDHINIYILIFSIVTGNMLGGIVMYYFGTTILSYEKEINAKMHAPSFIKRHIMDFAQEKYRKRAETFFLRYGVWFILISRFLPGIRYFTGILAGISGMNTFVYGLSYFFGSLIWGALLVVTGNLLGNHWERAIRWIQLYSWSIGLLFVIALSLLLYIKYLKRKR
jgi:membrane protein DedA with SNARE-associated domain